MMRALGIFVILLLETTCYGQERFYELVDGWTNNFSFQDNESYKTIGLEIIGSPVEHHFILNCLDVSGEVIGQDTFGVDSVETTSIWTYSSSIGIDLDSTLYLATHIGIPSTDRFYGTLFKFMKPNGPFELIAWVDESLFNQLVVIDQKNDSTLITGAYVANLGGYRRVFIYDIDFQGNQRWSFNTGCGDFCEVRIQQALPLSDGGIGVLLYEFDASLPTFEETKRSVLLKLSAEGEEEWRTYLGDGEEYRIDPGGIVEVDEEIIVSYTNTHYYDEGTGHYEVFDSLTVHLDYLSLAGIELSTVSLLNEIPNSLDWQGRYQYEVSQMQLLDDGDLLLTGTTGLGAHLLKVSTTGDVIWNREHFYVPWDFDLNADQQDNYIYHALPTSDGGFLCTGEYLHYPVPADPTFEQSAIALKVDEYGCLEPGCHLADGLIELGSSASLGVLRVYPNPTSAAVHVELPRTYGGWGQRSQLQLFDALGRRVTDFKFKVQDLNISNSGYLSLDLEALASGAYLLRIVTEQGLFSARIHRE